MSYGIKPEWKEAWRCGNLAIKPSIIRENVDLSVHLLAGWMRERFEREHEVTYLNNKPVFCSQCHYGLFDDPRHELTEADWLQAARKELGK